MHDTGASLTPAGQARDKTTMGKKGRACSLTRHDRGASILTSEENIGRQSNINSSGRADIGTSADIA